MKASKALTWVCPFSRVRFCGAFRFQKIIFLQLFQIWSSYCFHCDTDQLWTHTQSNNKTKCLKQILLTVKNWTPHLRTFWHKVIYTYIDLNKWVKFYTGERERGLVPSCHAFVLIVVWVPSVRWRWCVTGKSLAQEKFCYIRKSYNYINHSNKWSHKNLLKKGLNLNYIYNDQFQNYIFSEMRNIFIRLRFHFTENLLAQ